jgi:DNA-binding GntR family transcriptional regulator
MEDMRPIERPQSITGEVADRIRQAIISGDLALGEDLSERQLAEKLGVSKTPVREALSQLRFEGLVRASPPRGMTVFTLSAEEVREMCELRQALEVAAMRLAMERNPERLVAGLGSVLAQMTAALAEDDVKSYLAADTLFHLCFLENCGNSHLLETYKMHVGKIAALRTHLAQKPQHTEKSFLEHKMMQELLSRGDVSTSLDILDQHIDRTKRTYSSTIEDIAAADRGVAPITGR